MPATSGPRVIVTGGTGTLGRVIVRQLGQRGARVGLCFHRAEALARELAAELPGGGHAVRLDLTRAEEIGPAMETLAARLGGLDAFVHAAGLPSVADPPRYDALAELDDAGWDRLFAVNVKGAAFALKALAPRLEEAGGNVVFVGAQSGVKIVPAPAAYAASKAALVGLAQALAKELGPKGVRVNVVAPGLLDSGASESVPEALRREYLKHAALKRVGRHDEVARAVVFLALDNTYVNGRTLTVDGGL